MKNRPQQIIVFILNVLACVILFVCLALSTVTVPSFFSSDPQPAQDFFSILDRHGIPLAFLLTVLSLILIYFHQRAILMKGRDDVLRKEDISWLLEKTDLKFRGLFDDAPVGVFQTSPKGELIFSNTKMASVFGYSSAKEFIQAANRCGGFQTCYARPEARARVIKEVCARRREWYYFEEQFRRRDGSLFFAAVHVALRFDTERNEECFFGFIEDQTARIAADQKLRDSETRYRELIDTANMIMMKLDAQGNIRYLNRYAQRFFSYDEEEILGKDMIGTVFSEDILSRSQARELLEQIRQNPAEFFQRETAHRRKDASPAWISWSVKAMPAPGKDGEEILAVGVDITDRKAMEDSLERQIASEKLLQTISTDFFNAQPSDTSKVVANSLAGLSQLFDAGCFYVCFFDANGFVREMHSYSGKEDCDAKAFVERFYLSVVSWWFDKFQNDPVIIFPDVDAIADPLADGRSMAQQAGFRSIATVPIFHAERLVGFIGFTKTESGLQCDEKQIRLLRMCGELFFNALEKADAQRDLVESRKRLDFAVRGAYLGMYDWNIPSGNILFNDIWFRMLGYSPYELPHHFEMWKSLVHPDDLGHMMEALEQYLNGANSFYTEQYRLKTNIGEWKWILVQGHIVERDAQGKPVRMVGLHRDITELKHAEEQLRYQHDLFSSLIEHMPVGVFAKEVKDQFRILIWNKRMEAISGLSKEQVLGKHDHEIFDEAMADLYLKDDIEVVRSRQIKQIPEERMRTPLGEKSVSVVKVPVFDQDKVALVFGLLQDLTDGQQVEAQLRHTQKMNAIGQLAAGVAHEVKNPLAIILLAAEGLSYNPEVAQFPKVHSKIKMIKDAAVKANKVVMELLRFSRLSEGEIERIDLHKIIDDAHFLAQNKAKGKYITFEKRYAAGPVTCWGNAVLLEQVFVNLFGNAIDAIEKSGEVIVTTAVQDDAFGKKMVIIKVQDTGKGIPEEIRGKIFDPFFTTKEIGEGTGLGLNTVFTIIEKFHGHIRFESTVGAGTTFIISLPQERETRAAVDEKG
ncbi:MAG TPA: PAS domain S-box protein [Candidatus Bathyarchaeia archaeon]|nr:PAS domain S-box protein [Candidatus Bathyarchaeia archaeon]